MKGRKEGAKSKIVQTKVGKRFSPSHAPVKEKLR